MSVGDGGGGPVNPTRCKEKPWDLWVSEIGSDSPRRDDRAGRKPPPTRRRAGISLLRYHNMRLHGEFPQMDNLNAVVCHMCGATVKCSSASRHLASYHSACEPDLPPPSVPYVKLKTHSRSKHKKEAAVLDVERPVEPMRVSLPTNVYFSEQELKSVSVPVPVAVPVVGGEMQMCVDGELPVVSIQDPDELPLGENITDDIFAIMNSEGIQSAEDPDSTAAWKNIIQDISTLQEISFQQPDGEYSNADGALSAYSLPDELSNIQFVQPVPTATPTVLDAVSVSSAPPPIGRSRPKSKSKYNSREYDPNKHCGVITLETQKPCTRSLTCKAHTLSLRRGVEGRCKPFDTLLAEHKAAREAAALGALAPPPPVHAPESVQLSIPPSLLVNTSIDLSSFNSIATEQQVSDIYHSLLNAEDHTLPDTPTITSLLNQALPPDQFILTDEHGIGEVPVLSIASPVEPSQPLELPAPVSRLTSEGPPPINPSDVCWYAAPPRPLALCTFNATHAGGAVVLGRKFATVRGNIKSSLSRSQGKVSSGSNSYYNFSQNSSLSKTVQLNNASKCSRPAVRRLIVCGGSASVNTDFADDYARLNGHTLAGVSGKRGADSLQCDSKRLHVVPSTHSYSAPTPRTHTVKSKHSAHTSADMLELSFMLDPLVADDNC